jgi:hypothetical protein
MIPTLLVLGFLWLSCPALAGDNPPAGIDRAWYVKHYDFMAIPDTFFTYEQQFKIPEGFHRPDSAALTPFQYWVSHFPIWHDGKSVGAIGGSILYDYHKICRAVHLPWRQRTFTDRAIPIRILAEWLRYRHREYDFQVIPKKGQLLTYRDWLKGTPVYNSDMKVSLKPAPQRDSSAYEFYDFLELCMYNTSYRSITQNCDSIPEAEVAPGDIYAGYDETGKKGFTYVIMNVFLNSAGEKLYAVATGCPLACDFHMPLVNNDRNNPWLTLAGVRALAPGTANTGFFRFRIR